MARTIYSQTYKDFIAVDAVKVTLTFNEKREPIVIADDGRDNEIVQNWLRQMFKVTGKPAASPPQDGEGGAGS